jgi:hypothetical protein
LSCVTGWALTMDPSQWGNYQQYSRLTQSGLSAPHSAFPLLDQAGLGSSKLDLHKFYPGLHVIHFVVSNDMVCHQLFC